MREILFRGFTPDENGKDKAFVNGEWIKGQWVQGSYWELDKTTYCFKEDYERDPGNTEHYIVFDQMTDWGLPNRHLQADVLPETVGQYAGLTDKNGKKIFEGDILRYFVWGSFECFAVVRIGEYEQDGSGNEYPAIKVCGVYAEVKRYCPLIKEDKDCFPEYLKKSSLLEIGKDIFELVGNIYNNPELLKGEEENA